MNDFGNLYFNYQVYDIEKKFNLPRCFTTERFYYVIVPSLIPEPTYHPKVR